MVCQLFLKTLNDHVPWLAVRDIYICPCMHENLSCSAASISYKQQLKHSRQTWTGSGLSGGSLSLEFGLGHMDLDGGGKTPWLILPPPLPPPLPTRHATLPFPFLLSPLLSFPLSHLPFHTTYSLPTSLTSPLLSHITHSPHHLTASLTHSPSPLTLSLT